LSIIENNATKRLTEGQIAVAPLSVIAASFWDNQIAAIRSWPALQFPPADDAVARAIALYRKST
jgi:hypothetical protein